MLPRTATSTLVYVLALTGLGLVGETRAFAASPESVTNAGELSSDMAKADDVAVREPAVSTSASAFVQQRVQFVATVAIALQATAAVAPPYVFRPGAAGFGYYPVQPSPAATPRTTTTTTTTTRTGAPRGRYREFGSGRPVRLAKPWLRGLD